MTPKFLPQHTNYKTLIQSFPSITHHSRTALPQRGSVIPDGIASHS